MFAHSPLGSPAKGTLNLLGDPGLAAAARAEGVSVPRLLLAWGLLRGTGVVVTAVGASEQLDDLAAAELAAEATFVPPSPMPVSASLIGTRVLDPDWIEWQDEHDGLERV